MRAETEVNGSRAVTLMGKEGAETQTLFVSAEGEPYVLRMTGVGCKEPGSLEFSAFDEPVTVTPRRPARSWTWTSSSDDTRLAAVMRPRPAQQRGSGSQSLYVLEHFPLRYPAQLVQWERVTMEPYRFPRGGKARQPRRVQLGARIGPGGNAELLMAIRQPDEDCCPRRERPCSGRSCRQFSVSRGTDP